MIEGQTNIEPCAICGELSVQEFEVMPPEYESLGDGLRTLKKAGVSRWLCAEHLARAEEQRGWQERAAKARSERRKKLKAAQAEATLFDVNPGRKGHAA